MCGGGVCTISFFFFNSYIFISSFPFLDVSPLCIHGSLNRCTLPSLVEHSSRTTPAS